MSYCKTPPYVNGHFLTKNQQVVTYDIHFYATQHKLLFAPQEVIHHVEHASACHLSPSSDPVDNM